MPMVPFRKFFEPVAGRETRFFTIVEDNGLVPAGEYGLFESYCDEQGCDCRRVFINVIRAGAKAPDATIGFGWEDKAFYRKWMKAPLDDEVAFALSGAQLAVKNDPVPRLENRAEPGSQLVGPGFILAEVLAGHSEANDW